MKGDKKLVVVLAVLIAITAFLAYYTACAYYVDSYVIENGVKLSWPRLSEYTFLP